MFIACIDAVPKGLEYVPDTELFLLECIYTSHHILQVHLPF